MLISEVMPDEQMTLKMCFAFKSGKILLASLYAGKSETVAGIRWCTTLAEE